MEMMIGGGVGIAAAVNGLGSRARSPFEAALAQFCTAVPEPHAVFDSADDALLFVNAAFRTEFGVVPASRAAFEQSFEPVGVSGNPPAGVDEVRRVEMFCPRSYRRYLFHWSHLRASDDGVLLMLSAQNFTVRMDSVRQQGALRDRLLSSSRAMSARQSSPKLASLTSRERQVLELVVAGKLNKTIAYALGISTKTVEQHRASVMAKLDVHNVPDC